MDFYWLYIIFLFTVYFLRYDYKLETTVEKITMGEKKTNARLVDYI